MKRIVWIAVWLFSAQALGQSIEAISTDRPDQSEGVYTLPSGLFQLEGGLTLTQTALTHDVMLRYGVISGTEVRLETHLGNQSGSVRFDNWVFSTKQKLVEATDWMPAATLVGYLAYETFTKSIYADAVLAFERDITPKSYFVYNVGSANGFKNFITTVQLGTAILPELVVYTEYFGTYAPRSQPEHGMDVGLLYLINSNFQVDASFGRGIFSSQTNMYGVIGASYRFLK